MNNKNEPIIVSAPIQGYTDFRFRNIYQKRFLGIDAFYTPWIMLSDSKELKKSHIRDVAAENNKLGNIIPQILSNKSDDIIYLAQYLFDLGYEEINWNLGCPYPMVTKRGMGSALLQQHEKVVSILEQITPKIQNRLSIKMRLGLNESDEIFKLLPLLDDFPLSELIIHARTAKQMYKGFVITDKFEQCLHLSKHRIVYNGDILNIDDFNFYKNKFPNINKWMIGRGILINPFLPEMIKNQTGKYPENYKEIFLKFHDELLQSYSDHLSGEKHLLIKMTSFWEYFSKSFKDSHKCYKRIKKARSINDYISAVNINIKMM